MQLLTVGKEEREKNLMSYARMREGVSDVYVYLTIRGIECCGCPYNVVKLDPPYTDIFGFKHEIEAENFIARTSGAMIGHLKLHQSDGDLVPEYTFQRILEDFPDQTAIIDPDVA